eukprot:TRINITY_DN11611_c0_g2_i1.p1 TRINITY_DN11611_c0_g2~~TRINITY_DN11611_c0_g2_i1.p1  ORF type:complete len:858 (+),score=264.13 TRINITY_DN11611_c0_g2_i1:940-3513(+)
MNAAYGKSVEESEELKYAQEYTVEIVISERRINIMAHNQWCPINFSKQKNSIALASAGDVLRSNGSLVVDSVYQAEGVALIFVLEYTLDLLRKGAKSEQRQVVLGEYIYVPADIDSLLKGRTKLLKVHSKMNTDSELSVLQNAIWTPRMENWEIVLDCEIASSPIDKEITMMRKKQVKELDQSEEISISKSFMEKKPTEEKKVKKEIGAEIVMRPLLSAEVQAEPPEQPVKVLQHKSELRETVDVERIEPSEVQQLDLRADLDDELKGNSVRVSFIALIAKERMTVPERVCFSLKFFSFPMAFTHSAILRAERNSKDNIKYLMVADEGVKKWTNTELHKSKRQILRLYFDFDPTADPDIPPDIQTYDFLNYLAYNTMRIWVWDADGLIPVGSIKVELSKLLRGGRLSVKNTFEYDLLTDDNEVIGTIELKLKNLGRREGELVKKDFKSLGMTKLPIKGKTRIYSKPMTWDKIAELAKYANEPEDQKRKDDCVYGYRMKSVKENTGRRQPFWLQESLKAEVEKYRGTSRRINMPKILLGMEVHTASYPLVHYTLGHATLFPLPFANEGKFDTTYNLEIDDPEHIVDLVTNVSEWRFFCAQGEYETFSDWNIAQDRSCIPVPSEDHVLLILKVAVTSYPKVAERVITVSVRDNDNNEVALRKEIKLKFKETYYNAYYVMNVPEEQEIDIALAADLPNEVRQSTRVVRCSDEERVRCNLSEDKLTANYESPSVPEDAELFFYLYADEYCHQLLSIVHANVRAYASISLNGIAGKKMKSSVSFRNGEIAAQVELKSSDKKVLEIKEEYAGVIEAPAAEKIKVPLSLRSFHPGKRQFLLHLIGTPTCNHRLQHKEYIGTLVV